MDVYPWEIVQAQFNLLDSHDTARFINQAKGHWETLQQSLLFLMTIPGAPCLYYGTEIGMTGGPDPDCRRAFPWHDRASWNLDLLDYTKRAIRLRKEHPALRRGKYVAVYAHEDILAFARHAEEENALVLFNAGPEPRAVTLDVEDVLPDGTLTDVWAGLHCRVSKGTLRHLELPAQSGAVFVAGTSRTRDGNEA